MKFVIIAPARSGSTLLREMLNRHPDVCCHGEVYGKHRVNGLSVHARLPIDAEEALKFRRRNPLRFLEEHVFDSSRPVTGFKLLYSQMLDFDFASVLQHLFAMPDLHVIHLWRRRLVARHVSEARLRLKAASRQGGQAPEGFLDHALRPAVVERSCQLNLSARVCADKLFDRQPTLRLAYEDFIADHAAQSARLCDFLGVAPAGWPSLPEKQGERSDGEIARLEGIPLLRPYIDCP